MALSKDLSNYIKGSGVNYTVARSASILLSTKINKALALDVEEATLLFDFQRRNAGRRSTEYHKLNQLLSKSMITGVKSGRIGDKVSWQTLADKSSPDKPSAGGLTTSGIRQLTYQIIKR